MRVIASVWLCLSLTCLSRPRSVCADVVGSVKNAANSAGDAVSAELSKLKEMLDMEKKRAADMTRRLQDELASEKKRLADYINSARGAGNDDMVTKLQKEVQDLKKRAGQACAAGQDSLHAHLYNFQRSKKDASDIYDFIKAVFVHSFHSFGRAIENLTSKLPEPVAHPLKTSYTSMQKLYKASVDPHVNRVSSGIGKTWEKTKDQASTFYDKHAHPVLEKANTFIEQGIEGSGFYDSHPHLRGRIPPSFLDKVVFFIYFILGAYLIYLLPFRWIYSRLRGFLGKRRGDTGSPQSRRTKKAGGDSSKKKNQ